MTASKLQLGSGSRRGKGVTLIELLCVVGIFVVLASLLLGAIHAARRRADLKIYKAMVLRAMPEARDNLRRFYYGKTNFPAWTAEELHDKGVFNANIIRWIHADWIRFYPFESTETGGKSVMLFYWHTGPPGHQSWLTLMKSNVVNSGSEEFVDE